MTVRFPIAVFAGFAALAGSAPAQNEPRVGYVFPAGVLRGATTEVTVGGRYLEKPLAAWCAAPGVSIEVRSYERPLTNQERNKLRDEAEELDKQRKDGKLDDAGRARLAAIRKQLQASPRQPANPQIAETVVLAVTVAADAPLGAADLRVQATAGLSNPLRFVVDDARHARETEPNEKSPDPSAGSVLPIVIDGQILPGDVDRFVVHLQAGQRLVAQVQARALIPYLADAVPGWFQATLALADAQGEQVAFVDDHLFDPDPQLVYDVPRDGEYRLEVRDALFRGREDFVYRLSLRTQGGAATTAAGTSPPPLLGPFQPFAEREPNDGEQDAQGVPVPRVVLGRIERPGDIDVYAIEGHPGQPFVAEVLARRIGSPFDGLLRLYDPRGREIAGNDDCVDPGSGLVTHQADSRLECTFALQGTYRLVVRDLQGKGGEAYTYRLRVGPPQPDFALRVVPSAVNVRAGASAALTVHALRRDGFDGPIDLTLLDAPAGFELAGGRVPPGVAQIVVTLTAPANAPETPVRLALQGTAKVGKQQVVHDAVPAEDRMQAFAWRHLVPADELLACVLRGGPQLGRLTRAAGEPLSLRPGGTAEVLFDLAGARRAMPQGITCTLRDPPPGITVAETRVDRTAFRIVLKADKTVKRGLAGNLLFEATVDRPAPGDAAAKARPARQRLGLLLPAVPFQIGKP